MQLLRRVRLTLGQISSTFPSTNRWNQVATPLFYFSKFSTSTTVPVAMESGNQQAASDPKASITQMLSSVILRHQAGDERFQISITINNRKFNFDRSLTEATSVFLERVKANISKKFKKQEIGRLSLLIGSQELGTEHEEPVPVSSIIHSLSPAKLRIGDEEAVIDVNPPEVFSIKFLKLNLVGFPVLPLKIEGSTNFDLGSSEFLWESRPAEVEEDNTAVKKMKRPRRPSQEVWTVRAKSLALNLEERDNNSYLRFTVFPSSPPSSDQGNQHKKLGLPLTVELPHKVTKPLYENFLYRDRVKDLENLVSSTAFRLISYNALSEHLTTPEWFKTSPVDSLEIDYRLPLLNAELKAYQGDLLCLQEIDQKHFERNFTKFLGAECGLRGVFSLKTGEDPVEGLATFYNPSKFLLLQSETLDLKDAMTKLPFYSNLENVPGLLQRLVERNSVLQVSVFDYSPSHIFIVGNTHLYFKPDADHIRLLQTITCLRTLEEKSQALASQNPEKVVSVIFCGDFNCTPPFSSYRLAVQGKVSVDDVDWNSHETEKISGFEFKHNLKLSTAFPKEELTTIVTHFEGCIDYMFYQPHVLRLTKSYPPPTKKRLSELIGIEEDKISLPNFQAPSDHLPIIADFSLIP